MTSFEINVAIVAVTAAIMFAALTVHATWTRRHGGSGKRGCVPDMPNIPPPPTEVKRQVPTHYWLDIGNNEQIRLTLYRVEGDGKA